jgi:membrane-bound ClpP family serine protease
MGLFFFSEALTPGIVLGGCCIITSIIGVTWLMRAPKVERASSLLMGKGKNSPTL